jgi:hypothetical protein
MENTAWFSGYKTRYALVALAVFGVQVAYAAPADLQQRMDCKVYEQQEQANLEAQRQANPSIHSARLDTVFYSAKRDACLASVFFTKGDATYAGIVDISGHQTLWAKSYKGTKFTPAHVLEMDEEMDEAIRGLELAPTTTANSHAYDFLPLLFDRTMNTLPAIKNALSDPH